MEKINWKPCKPDIIEHSKFKFMYYILYVYFGHKNGPFQKLGQNYGYIIHNDNIQRVLPVALMLFSS